MLLTAYAWSGDALAAALDKASLAAQAATAALDSRLIIPIFVLIAAGIYLMLLKCLSEVARYWGPFDASPIEAAVTAAMDAADADATAALAALEGAMAELPTGAAGAAVPGRGAGAAGAAAVVVSAGSTASPSGEGAPATAAASAVPRPTGGGGGQAATQLATGMPAFKTANCVIHLYIAVQRPMKFTCFTCVHFQFHITSSPTLLKFEVQKPSFEFTSF